MNKNRRNIILLPLVAVLLTSCKSAVEEVYDLGQFHTQEFLDNYFRTFPDELKDSKYNVNSLIYDLEDSDFAQSRVYQKAYTQAIMKDLQKGLITFDQLIELYGDDAVKAIKESNYSSETAYLNAITSAMAASTRTTWNDYARANHLAMQNYGNPAINDFFKKGMFSKMTDGLLACDGSGPLVRMQIDENGFGRQFDYELIDYSVLTLSLRGGTNIPYHELLTPRIPSASINLTVSFYIEESISNEARKVTFNFPIEDLRTDDNAQTNIIQLYFEDVMSEEELPLLKRANAMSVSYELLDHEMIRPGGVDNPENDYEFAVMMYEVMLPYSIWN